MSRNDSWHRKISTGRHFQNGHHNTAQIQHCSISTSWIDSRYWKISTGLHFQNGRHNTAKIQHFSISKVAFNLFFKPVVCGWFGRLHNRLIIVISCFYTKLAESSFLCRFRVESVNIFICAMCFFFNKQFRTCASALPNEFTV